MFQGICAVSLPISYLLPTTAYHRLAAHYLPRTTHQQITSLEKNIDIQILKSLGARDAIEQFDYYFYKFKTQTQIPMLTPGLPRSFNGKFRFQENLWFLYEMLLWLHDKPHCFVNILILSKL